MLNYYKKKAVRVVNFKSPVAHTEPLLKNMNQLKLPDLYTFHLLKLYYKLYRNKLPPYFENFIPQYGAYHQNLRNNHIRLPAIRCEFEKHNSKYQMHFRLRELASPSNPPLYPNIDISNDILSQSLYCFAKYVKSKYISSYYVTCRVGVKYSTCTWYLYLSTYLSVLDVLEYLVYGNAKVLVLVLVLDQKVLGTYK